MNLAAAKGQHSFEAVQLLEVEGTELAHGSVCNGADGVSVRIKGFEILRKMYQRYRAEHHSLIAGGEVIHKLPVLLTLLFQTDRQNGGEVLLLILTAVPCSNGGFGAKGTLVDLPNGLVHGHRQNVDAQKNLAIHGGQLCDQRILDVAGIVPEIHHPPKLSVYGEVIPFHRNAVGADGIQEAVPTALGFFEAKGILLPSVLPENAAEYLKPLFRTQCFAVGTQPGELGNQVRAHPRKVAAGIGQASGYRHRHIFVLTIGIFTADLGGKHLVVLTAVMIQLVIPEGNPAVLPYRGKVHAPVMDGDFHSGIVVQTV